MNEREKNNELKQAEVIKKDYGVDWWWLRIGSEEWNRITDGMSRKEFVADWQDSAFRYEVDAREHGRYKLGAPWIDLSEDQRRALKHEWTMDDTFNSDKLVISTLLPRQRPVPRKGWSNYFSVNLRLQKETLLRVIEQHIKEEKARQETQSSHGGH